MDIPIPVVYVVIYEIKHCVYGHNLQHSMRSKLNADIWLIPRKIFF